jgi:uncharacterized protein involved in outer membrane biogenesis
MFKRILIGSGLVVILLVGAIFILPTLIATDTYRARLETELSRVIARDVSITGDIQISTFPAIQIETGAVALANAEGFKTTNFVEVEGLDAKVKLWPLFRKQVEISQISLNSPNIWLERKADGTVNWSTTNSAAAQNATRSASRAEKGFQRDGRFTDYDPALDLLSIKNGQIRFIDSAADRDVSIRNANLDLRAPALSKPIKIDGDMTLDDLAVAIAAELASPLDFLNGDRTPFDGSVTTDLGNVEISGHFLASDALNIDAIFDLNSSDPLGMAARLPLPEHIKLPALNTVNAKGRVVNDGAEFNVTDLETNLNGNGFDVSYTGQFSSSDTRSAKGAFKANLSDMSVLTPYLSEPIPALNALNTLKANGNLTWNGNAFDLTDLVGETSGQLIDASYKGSARYEKALTADGRFDVKSPDVARLVDKLELNQPDAAALKAVTATGAVKIAGKSVSVTDLQAEATQGLVNGNFTGALAFDETLSMQGVAKAVIADLSALSAALPRVIPFADVAKRVSFAGDVQVANGTFSLNNTDANLTEGDVNGSYRGEIALGQEPDIQGTLTLAVPSLRTLSTKRNVSLPANTPSGSIFEALSISGQVSGVPDLLEFTSGKMALDGLSGKGDFKLSLQTSRPTLTGEIAFSDLNLQPYMAAWSAQKPAGQIVPWSTSPINVSGLNAIDADLRISAPSIKMTRLALGDTNARLTLKNGTLESRIENTNLYGGTANGVFTLRSIDGSPDIALNADIKSVKAQELMMAMGGFDKVTGTSNFAMEIIGSGKSQAAIMRTLSGKGQFTAANGQLLGVNAETLLKGIDEAITNRQLPSALGLGQTTDFSDLTGGFTVSNGQVGLQTFQLQSGALFMEGGGGIDLGEQTLDIGIRPKLNSGSDVANFGVPLRFSGAFGQAKPSLDTNLLGQIAQAKVRQSAGDAVKDRVGGPLGNIIGSVIGGDSNEQTSKSPSTIDTPTDTAAPAEETNQADDTVVPEKAEETKPEEEVLKRLNGLFGGKKRSD